MRILLCQLILLPFTGFSQKYLDKSKSEIKKELEQYIKTHSSNSPSLQETDSTVILRLTEAGQERQTVYGFDAVSGKCSWEKQIASGKMEYNKLLQELLSQKSFGWKKLNENQYVSKFSSQMLIELPQDENDYSFIIFRTNWTKELYDLLTSN
jgi:hypothetical protein